MAYKHLLASIVPVVTTVLLSGYGSTAVWDYKCATAIRQLSDAQRGVRSAHRDLEFAKKQKESAEQAYSRCTPNQFATCDLQRSQAEKATVRYNEAVEKLEFRMGEYEGKLYNIQSSSCVE